ncbi:polyprenyl diphosphate synthase [Candidatus Pelagibacter communis]|uniref:polyprenyl diphosphate synthase n=1 Tax=Pelagibacter ubique TaxID=198252 RepID=UPI00094DB989|nr:polyprenyl diphosphate synthase [Candidatus Pelagibacter ubique]
MIGPKHVAIIMDGNGRWGLKKKNSRNLGHKKGIIRVEEIIKQSIKKKIKFLTLYTFSSDNWKRPKIETNFLFTLLENYIDKEFNNLKKKNIKIKILGDIDKFPPSLKIKLRKVEKNTNYNTLIQINLALNYGSRQELVNAFKIISIKKKRIITEKLISDNLYTKNIPDPEILIRTGNTNRLSNFLLWQINYTEIFFVKKLWPDFGKNDFNIILNKFNKIKRNFGAI